MGLVTDFSTTNPDTVENVIQVGEIVTLNIIMYLPEVNYIQLLIAHFSVSCKCYLAFQFITMTVLVNEGIYPKKRGLKDCS